MHLLSAKEKQSRTSEKTGHHHVQAGGLGSLTRTLSQFSLWLQHETDVHFKDKSDAFPSNCKSMVSKALRSPWENTGETLIRQGAMVSFHIKGTVSGWGCCDEITHKPEQLW